MCADLGTQVFQIAFRIAPHLVHVCRMAVARDHISGVQCFEFIVPCLKPVQRISVLEDGEHPFMERHVARDDEVLIWQPDNHISGTV